MCMAVDVSLSFCLVTSQLETTRKRLLCVEVKWYMHIL